VRHIQRFVFIILTLYIVYILNDIYQIDIYINNLILPHFITSTSVDLSFDTQSSYFEQTNRRRNRINSKFFLPQPKILKRPSIFKGIDCRGIRRRVSVSLRAIPILPRAESLTTIRDTWSLAASISFSPYVLLPRVKS